MSTGKKNPIQIVITTQQILDAYAAHGSDMIQINLESCRKYKEYSQYLDIDIKLADGTVSGVRYWKMSDSGIILASRIKKPEQRKYESIRIGFNLRDAAGVENENAKALQILSIAVEEKLDELKKDHKITDDKRDVAKYGAFQLISTKVVTPMQTTRTTKEGDIEELDNPAFWINLPKKKFYAEGETRRPITELEGKFYADESGRPDETRPIRTYEFDSKLYNIDDFYHQSRTGKKILKLLGAPDPSGKDNYVDNTNIHEYLTKGSAMLGNFKFELVISARQCKLDISLFRRCNVKVAEVIEQGGDQDDERIDAFSSRYANIGISSKSNDEENEESFDDDDN